MRTSFLQRIPRPARVQKLLTPLYPLAFRSFDVKPFDVVVSSASFAAKGIPRHPTTLHVCYCYTPPRFLWGMTPATDRRQLSWPLRGLGRVAPTPLASVGPLGRSATASSRRNLPHGGSAYPQHLRHRANRHLSTGGHAPLSLAAHQ